MSSSKSCSAGCSVRLDHDRSRPYQSEALIIGLTKCLECNRDENYSNARYVLRSAAIVARSSGMPSPFSDEVVSTTGNAAG